MSLDTTTKSARGARFEAIGAGRHGPATEPATDLAPTPASPTADCVARPDGETIVLRPGPNPSIPTQIDRVIAGRYCLERELGRGGFGVVWLAYDRVLDRQVAIKIARRTPERGLDQLLEEGRKVAQLDHPNIVPVFDSGRFDGQTIFIVSKYVDGGSLARLLNLRALPIDEATRIAEDVAGALSHAHERGLIHRDLKPSNILIDSRGRAYVADFGLALRTTDRTDMACVEGSPLYMSPEQAGGKSRMVDRRSDVFSFGVILYEMLTGHRPFPGKTTAEFRQQVNHIEPPPPRQLKAEIPERLEQICLKAMAKDPDERHASGWELSRELGELRPASHARLLPWRRAQGLALAAAALLLLALVFAWFLRNGLASPPPPVPEPPTPTPTPTAEMAIAEWVLDRGGRVDFVDYPAQISSRSQLPQGPASLRVVDLYKVQPVTVDDVERLATLPSLLHLHLSDTGLTEESLDVIAGMTDLEMLWLGWNPLTDRGIAKLGALTNLFWLNLEETQVSDEGVEAICAIRGLKAIDLGGTRVTDRGIRHLAGLPRLAELRLDRTEITDACVDDLLRMDQLETLELQGTDLSFDAIRKLEEGLPHCTVKY